MAIDPNSNIWVTNKAGNSVSIFSSSSGQPLSGSPYMATGNLSGPVAVAFDAAGSALVGNSTGNSVTQVNSSGIFVQQITTNITAPTAIAMDLKKRSHEHHRG